MSSSNVGDSAQHNATADVMSGMLLDMGHIYKRFGQNQVLTDVAFQLGAGEVVGLLGANGAGKSTLTKIIVGTETATSGTMALSGTEVTLQTYNTLDASKAGIFCVYQELSLCTNLKVFENFYLTSTNPSAHGWRKDNAERAQAALDTVFPHSGISATRQVAHLNLAQRQMVEIARTLTQSASQILILDEPTSALSRERVVQLHDYIEQLKSRGIGLIYVTHKLEELRSIASRIVVLRNGNVHFDGPIGGMGHEEILQLLSGRTRDTVPRNEVSVTAANLVGETLFSLEGLNMQGLHDITLHINPGEIVGIAGLDGAGQRALLRTIFELRHGSGRDKALSMAYVTGDRQAEGIFSLWNIYNNMVISSLSQFASWGIFNKKQADERVEYWYRRLSFRATSPRQSITELSGGNQQKTLIGRGLASEAQLLLLDDPTRGVDVDTKQEIYDVLRELKKSGCSAIFFSTEDNEFLQCDRVYVMNKGSIVAELRAPDMSVPDIVHASYQQAKTAADTSQAESRRWLPFGKLGSISSPAGLSIGLLITVVVISGVLEPSSVGTGGLDLLVGGAVPLVLAALAEMFVIMAGDIDLSIGAALGLVNVIGATYLVHSPLLGLLFMVLVVVAYALMAALIHVRRLPAIVVTLGASFVWLGVALVMQPIPGGTSPGWLTNLYNLSLPVIPEPIYLVVLFVLVGYALLFRSRLGTVLRGFGNNPAAIYRAGRSPMRARIILYVLAAVCIVLSGLAITAVSSASDANASATYTLSAIAAVILGGAEFTGGTVYPTGAVAGALVLALLSSLLAFLSVSTNYETAVTGAILLAALATRQLGRKVRS